MGSQVETLEGGHLKLTHFLGDGSFGEVYAGTRLGSGESRAVKFPKLWRCRICEAGFSQCHQAHHHVQREHPEVQHTKDAVQHSDYFWKSFQKEKDTMQELQRVGGWSAFVVHMVGYGIYENMPYLVLEQVQMDLWQMLELYHARGLTLRVDAIKSIMQQLLLGLRHLHQCHFVHADLKPENVGVMKNRIKLLDLGGAHQMGTYLSPIQTLWYRAPEAMTDDKYTEKVDIWSAGCIFLELTRGSVAFRGRNDAHQRELVQNAMKNYAQLPLRTDPCMDFVRSMLCTQQKRHTSAELCRHPFLRQKKVIR